MHDGITGFHIPDADAVERRCELFRILSDPTRLRLLYALVQGESSVTCLADIVGASPTVVSQHLSKLRMMGIVHARRQGTFMFYTVADPAVEHILGVICLGMARPTAFGSGRRSRHR
jgi:DNA-binding transcriptional ArsR family regulator